ncbi:hypothetical protein Tco_0869488 [Tanacetum coccineum]
MVRRFNSLTTGHRISDDKTSFGEMLNRVGYLIDTSTEQDGHQKKYPYSPRFPIPSVKSEGRDVTERYNSKQADRIDFARLSPSKNSTEGADQLVSPIWALKVNIFEDQEARIIWEIFFKNATVCQ